MAAATATTSSQLIFTKRCSVHSRLCPSQLCVFNTKSVLSRRKQVSGNGVRCMAIKEAAATTETKKRSGYDIQTLTNWLLKQEQRKEVD